MVNVVLCCRDAKDYSSQTRDYPTFLHLTEVLATLESISQTTNDLTRFSLEKQCHLTTPMPQQCPQGKFMNLRNVKD